MTLYNVQKKDQNSLIGLSNYKPEVYLFNNLGKQGFWQVTEKSQTSLYFQRLVGGKSLILYGASQTFSAQISLKNDRQETDDFMELFWAHFARK